MGSDRPRGRESDSWQCDHGSGDPSGCAQCREERKAKKAQEDDLLNKIVQRPSAPASGKKSIDENPLIASIKARLEGQRAPMPERARRQDSGEIAKEHLAQEGVGDIANGIDAAALNAFVAEVLSNPKAPGSLGEFARALEAAKRDDEQDAGSDRPSAPKIGKPAPGAVSGLAGLQRYFGQRMGSAPAPRPQKRESTSAMLVTRAVAAMPEGPREEVRAMLLKKRRQAPKTEPGGSERKRTA
jgi:hypothetical protein